VTFTALIVDKNEEGAISQTIQEIDEDQLPEGGDVTIAVEYSTLNYKDGLCLTGAGGLVRAYPHVPGVDFAGTVEASEDFVPLPDGLSTKQAMAVGTAGFTAMLAVMALEDHGLTPGDGEVLVTGAAGGVGSVATAILAHGGYQVAGVTGRPETADYLKALGAETIVAREELNEPSKRPLESERWSGCIDAVGGVMLSRVLAQMRYGASVAAVGLAGGAKLETTVIPFLLRGVNLLGIDSVMRAYEDRIKAWGRIASDLPMEQLESMIQPATLSDLPALGAAILKGQVRGRVVVDLNA
jgi:acrylyl-CoA reductase (NADPH)